jgi:hypothetical protein
MIVRLALSAFLLSALFCFGSDTAAKPADLALHDIRGSKVRLRDYRGKIVVLNFWVRTLPGGDADA